MIGILLALFSGVVGGISVILARKKIGEAPFFNFTIYVTLVGNLILWPLAFLLTNFREFYLPNAVIFIVAGIFAPGISRLLYFKAMKTVGTSVNASIFATYPLYTTVLGVYLLNEEVSQKNWIGILCIVLGIVITEYSVRNVHNRRTHFSKNVVFAILAAFAVAVSEIILKLGLNVSNEPVLGAAIGYSVAILIYLVSFSLIGYKIHFSLLIREVQRFWMVGALISISWILAFYALSFERVSIVAPLSIIEPIFVLFFAWIFLKKLETISWKLVLNTLLIIFGVILVVLE